MGFNELKGKNILVCITGCIAAYKTIEIIRLLKKSGAEVNVVLTKNAAEFVTPLTLQTISQGVVYSDMFNRTYETPIKHISLSEWADCVLIAPATANIIAKISYGLADDLLSTLVLSTTAPLVIAPAMNVNMWCNSVVQENIARLSTRGFHILDPEKGELACGDVGEGRLLEPQKIIANLTKIFKNENDALQGKKILITAGPTYEAIDPVRFLGNHSSGKMGYALAESFAAHGAEVTLISGPTNLTCSNKIKKIDIISAQEMFTEVMQRVATADLFMSVAAVADFRPHQVSNKKIKRRTKSKLTLDLVANPDILATVSKMENRPTIVGFAAETDNLAVNAKKKFKDKKLDMLVANMVGNNIGFNSDCNEVKIITAKKNYDFKNAHKKVLATKIVDLIKVEFF